MTRRRRANGFTIIELMIVVLVMSLLAGIALLKYLDLRNTARSSQVAGDFRSVMVAAYNYQSDHDAWPADGPPGIIPPALAPYLPSSFTFNRPEYQLEFENIGLGGGAAMIGVTVTSSDGDLMAKLKQTLGTKLPYFAAGNALTYIISTEGGA
jgi:prepilin-type N-terminal cleavage/methylation domain-containing protein